MPEVKIKKLHPEAKLPEYALEGDAGLDLVAISEKLESTPLGDYVTYDTGLAFEIPEGYVGLLFPRSSISTKTSLMLSNSVGVLDSNYRGSVTFRFRNLNEFGAKRYKLGERIGQIIIIPYPKISFVEVDELTETNRGSGGYGSTGA